jgi:hypothetical protein
MGIFTRQSAVFNGVTPSEKNKEFVTARFTLAEVYKGNVLQPNSLNKPNVVVPFNVTKNQKLIDSLNSLTVDQPCAVDLDIDIEQPNGVFKAKLKFELLDCKPIDKKAA